MRKFMCWEPDGGEEESDAHAQMAFDAESAAEIRAEHMFRNGDPFKVVEILVRDGAGETTRWLVSVDYSPNFRATKRKEQPK